MTIWGNCYYCEDPFLAEREDYMVTDEVWREANLPRNCGVVHLPCLEIILGRELELQDFNLDAISNWMSVKEWKEEKTAHDTRRQQRPNHQR